MKDGFVVYFLLTVFLVCTLVYLVLSFVWFVSIFGLFVCFFVVFVLASSLLQTFHLTVFCIW